MAKHLILKLKFHGQVVMAKVIFLKRIVCIEVIADLIQIEIGGLEESEF